MTLLNFSPTHVNSIIDYLFSNFADVCNLWVYNSLISDVSAQILEINTGVLKMQTILEKIFREIYNDTNLTTLNIVLGNVNWLEYSIQMK